MMNRVTRFVALTAVAVAFLGCESRTDKVDGGGVLLSVSDFDGLPIIVSASQVCSAGGQCLVSVDQIILQNIPKDPFGSTSDLMNVEIQSYEVVFTREDGGSRVPPPLVQSIFGVVPVGGTSTLDNYPVMRTDQFNNVPLRDLLDVGFDRETGSTVVRLRLALRFFGRTLSGKPVDSAPAYWSVEVVP
jgi:hypothetical protein